MSKVFRFILPLFGMFLFGSCSSKKTVDLSYLQDSKALKKSYPELDVYQPKKQTNNPVVIFIHGGYWDEGKKDIYGFLGRNFAKKDVVTVIPNYTLSPNGNYNTMAEEVAAAVRWTHENIKNYNGNPDQIFLMGHSAGGHLIALAGTNPKYFKNQGLVKGIILNDSAGLDMYNYLKEHPPVESHHHYISTWTDNEENWKAASPINFVNENSPPFLIYVGTKSYESITTSNKAFIKELNKYQPDVDINYLNKKHVPMMSQFFIPWNKHYKEIINFIETNK